MREVCPYCKAKVAVSSHIFVCPEVNPNLPPDEVDAWNNFEVAVKRVGGIVSELK